MVIETALIVAVLVGLAEWRHARRMRRIARLAFGQAGRARAWTRGVGPARAAAAGAAVWGGLTLMQFDGSSRARDPEDQPPRHLIICLDVSPSMQIEDAGPRGDQTRAARASAVISSMLDRLDTERTRVSVVPFYTEAKPIVVDTHDLNVVSNIVKGLPVDHAFEHGRTDMYSGVRAALELARRWPENTTSIMLVSDGDTLPSVAPPTRPLSIADAMIVGVGNPHRGRTIAGRSSKQNAHELERLALRLGGVYHEANQRHVPTDVLLALGMTAPSGEDDPRLRALALTAVAAGAGTLALISPALALLGAPEPQATRKNQIRAARPRSRGSSMDPAAGPPSSGWRAKGALS